MEVIRNKKFSKLEMLNPAQVPQRLAKELQTPKTSTKLADKSSTPSRSILKNKVTATTEKKTPSRITFGHNETKTYEKITSSNSSPDATQVNL